MELIEWFYHWLNIMAFSSARIMPIFIMLPFLNSNVINNTIRLPVVIFLGMALWPEYNNFESSFEGLFFLVGCQRINDWIISLLSY